MDKTILDKVYAETLSPSEQALAEAVKVSKENLAVISQIEKSNLDAQTTRAKDRAVSPNAVVSDTDLSTLKGQLTNLAIGAGAKTVSVLGDVIQAPAKLWRENELASANITQEDIDNYWSLKNKQVQESQGMDLLEGYTEAEKALTQPNIGKTRGKGTYMTTHDAPSKAQTLDEYFEAEKDAQVSRTYVYDAGLKYTNDLKKNEIISDAKKTFVDNKKDVIQGFEELKKGDLAGIGKMVAAADRMGVDALVSLFTNPSGTAQLAAEAVPSALISAVNAPMSAAAYGTAYIRDAEEMYRKEYSKMPLGTDRAIMVGTSMLAGGVGTYADRLLGGSLVKAVSGDTAKAAGAVAADVAEGSFKEGAKKVTQELIDSAVEIASVAGKEGITEAAEQALNEYAGKQDIDKMDGAEIFANGVAGFGAGGMLSGSSVAVGKVNDFAKSVKADVVAKEATKTVLAADAKADETTSEQGVVNPEVRKGADLSSSLGIAKVIRNARTVLEKDETDQGTREDTILFAKHALSSIDNRLDATAEKLADVEDMAKVEGISEDAQKLLESTKGELLKEQKRLQKIKNENAEKITAEYDALVSNPEVYEAAKSRLTAEKLDELADMDTQEVSLDEDGNTPTDTAVNNELDKDAALLTASSLVTENVTPEDLEAAANSPKISPQRAVQLKETAALNRLIAAAKSSAMIAKDIIDGGEGFVGIKQYQQRVTEHLNSGSLRTAARDLGSLGKFALHHESKAAAYEAALAEAQKAPKGTRIEVEGFRTLPTKQNPQGNPVTLDANAGKLVSSVRQEADLIKGAFTSLANQVMAFAPKQTETKATSQPDTVQNTVQTAATPVTQKAVQETQPVNKTESAATTEVKPETKPKAEPEVKKEATPKTQSEPVAETVTEVPPKTATEDTNVVAEQEEVVVEEEVSPSPVTKSVNQGSRAGLKPKNLTNAADAQYLMTNPVTLFKRIKQGVLWTINYKDTNAVAEALNRELTPSEGLLLDKLPVFMGGFEARLRSLLPTPEVVLSKRGWQSVSAPLQAFSQEDGTFSKEFTEAMAISALEYLESNSLALMGDNTSGIATLLGLDSKDFVPTREQYEALTNVGSPYTDMAQKLGAIALKNMGMKKDSSKPQNLMNNMEYDLGRAILGTLNGTTRENGILTVTSYKISDLVALGGDYTIDPNNAHASIETVVFNPKVVANFLGVKDVTTLFGGTNGFLATLTSNKTELPKAEIGVKTQNVNSLIRRSKGQRAPKEFVEGLQKDANVPNYVDLNMHTLFNELGKSWFAYMLGTRDASRAILGKRPSIEGKNKTAEVDLTRYEMFLTRMQETAGNLTAPFFYNYRIGKQLRASAIGSDINFQTSKFHRYMTAMEPSEIDMVDDTNQSFTLFKLGVAQGLGFGVDKKTLEASLAFYDSVLADPVFMNGVYAIKEILSGIPTTDGHRQAILTAVEKGEEATHSLKSLAGLAEMLMATDGKFNTTVTLELDGVTNGVANAHIQMGLAISNDKLTETSRIRLAQSGFFLDGTETYNEWINRAGNMDMYQSTAVAANVAEQSWVADPTNQDKLGVLATFKKYTGELVKETVEGALVATSEGRNFVKNPITTTVYASGAKSRSDKMADKVMDNLLDAIEEAALARDAQRLNELKQDISTLAGMRITFPRNMMEFEFNSFIAKGIKYSFSKSLGAIVNEAIAEEFAKQLDNTALVTETSNVIFDMFNALYQSKIKEKLSELRSSGELSNYAYLSENQLDEIKNSLLHTMPVFNSFYGDIKNGVMTAKYSSTSNVNSMDKDVKSAFHLGSALGHRGSNYSYTDGYEAPAAGTMAILNIAFGDATTMARAAYKSDEPLGLNVFDARLSRIANVAGTATALNDSAYEAVTYHNLLETVNTRLQEAAKEFMQHPVSKTYSPEILALAHKVVAAHHPEDLVLMGGKAMYKDGEGKLIPMSNEEVGNVFTSEMLASYMQSLTDRMSTAYAQSQRAKQVLNKPLSVNQFSSVTGGAKFANGKRQVARELSMEEAANAQARLETQIVETVMESSEPLTGDIDQTFANLEAVLPPIETTTSSEFTIEPKLEGIINGRTEFPLADILNNLKELTDARTARAMRELLSNLRGTDVQVKILGANEQHMIATSLGEMSTESLYGYWEPNEKTIYLQGTHSPNTGVRIETILHEAVHAALDSRLSSIEQQVNQGTNLGHSTKEIAAYKQLEQMRKKAKEFLDADATVNIKEFIAWGLTNAQNRGLLAKQTTRVRAFVKGIITQLKSMLGLKTEDSNMLIDLLANAMIIGKAGTEVLTSLDNTIASSPQVAHDATRYMDLNQIYDHIAKSNTNAITPNHDAHLREVLNEAVIKAINPTLLVIPDNAKTLSSQDAALLHAIDPEIRKDFGLLTALNFRVSDQELMVYATYSTIIDSALNEFGWNTREIRRMYAHAKKHLSWRDFIGQDSVLDTEADRARSEFEARARYKAVFENTQTNDYLRNFMALAATNEAFRDSLAKLPTPPTVSKAIKGATVRETLQNILEAILNFFNDLAITRSHEPSVLAKLDKLAKNIRHREIKEKNKLQSKIIKAAKFTSKVLNTVNEFSRIKIDKVFDKMKKKVSKRRILNAAVTLSSVVMSERRASEFALGLDTLQNFMTQGREGFVSSLWTDLKGTDDSNIRIHGLLAMKNKLIDQETVNVKTNTSILVNELFGRELTDKESVAATKVLLASDVSSLLTNGYSFAQVANFLDNPLAIKNEVTKLQVAIRQQAPKGTDEYYINQAKNTAHMMIRGYQKYRGHVMSNAAAIVTLFGTGEANPNASMQVRSMVDSLITLEGLQLVEPVELQMMGNLYKSEAARKSENGIESLLAMHNVVKDKVLKSTFLGNEFNYVKGYITDITDPYMSIQIAPKSMENELLMQNYERVGEPLVKDKHDPMSEQMYMYVSNYGGEATYLQGALSIANKAARGMSVLDGYNQAGNALPIYKQREMINKIHKAKVVDNQKLFMPTPPLADNELVPTFDSKGRVTDYRYIMKQEVKDTLLRRDNRIAQVFGAMSASASVKKNTVTVNSALMKALYDQYNHDRKNNNVGGYLLVEPNSKDKQLAEIWHLMPYEAQKEATALFGMEGVYVRKDVINAAFGYRKWTVANLWSPDSDYPEIVKNGLNQLITSIYGQVLAKSLMMGERGLQEVVKEAKDIIVIKSVVVLASNFLSNTVQLFLFHDVNPLKAVSDQITAITAAKEYNKNAKGIFALQAKVDANLATPAQRLKLRELLQDQAKNPVKGLIDAGMLQTIVDDASVQEDLYSFKHGLVGKIEEMTAAIPEGVKEAFIQTTFQQGSIAYDFLREATQFSDFAARFALYNHQVNNEGVSHDKAIQNIIDAFVNYDLPPHKGMQYLNDMGITWFFKYFIRMQKVIMKSFRRNPAKVLGLSVGADMLGLNIPTPLDAFAPFVDVSRKIGLIDGISMTANALPLTKVF
ncbi:MAG: virion RNA polymerase [Podoviridae sp. ctLUJ1]|nr:MAG: virion RNA polymerase [Podoviridae sp. ctLUJ1]